MREVLTTACPLDCPDSCSLAVTVDDGRIVAIDADTSDTASPFTQGYICSKVKHQAKRVYAPERVLTPLIRTGPKGSGEFREASWDEASRLVADRIARSIRVDGPQSVLPYLYSSSAGVLAANALTPLLFERLGCPEIEHTICAATVTAAWDQVYGSMLSADPFDVVHSKLVVVWGANPNASNTHFVPLITKAVKENGATLVVVDPRRTGVAGRADLHLAIRPGTDSVLAYAVTRWLVEHQAHDTEFIAENVDGADAFIAAAEEWTLDRAADVCGVEAGHIGQFASLIATSSPAMMRLGLGLERNRNGGSGCVGALSMWAVAGHFGVLGSGVIGSTSGSAPLDLGPLWPSGLTRHPRTRLNMNDVGLALVGELTGWPAANVLVVQGANPVATVMDQACFIRGLERDDLFTVVHEQVMTDTAVYADVVLPATTSFEAADLVSSYGTFSMLTMQAVIDRVGESRTNDELAAALAAHLGLPSAEFDPDPERLAARVRTDRGTAAVPTIRQRATTVQFVDTRPGFADGSTRIRVHDPSSELSLPRFVAPAAGTSLTLLTPATNRTINSMFAEFEPPAVAVSLHADDAASRRIADGDRVRVFNDLGSIELIARIDGSARPGVASIPKGLWRRHFDGRLTANALIPREINDLAGGACFNDARVEVEPVRPDAGSLGGANAPD